MAVDLFLSDSLGERTVQAQGRYRRPTRRRDADNTCALPAEVCPPHIATRIEQRRVVPRLRIGCGSTRPLAERTRDTGERQVVESSRTVGSDGHDVIHMEGRLLPCLGKATIFAPPTRSLDHLPSQAG